MKGISLHIGLNKVDPAHYGGWAGKLSACEFDASKMKAIAASEGYSAASLLTSKATRKNVIDEIKNAAKSLSKEDIFLLTYSGHGSQVPDRNGTESDFLDETWCLYDGQLIDDELFHLWSLFAEGVRVLVFSDSCHSGSVIKAMKLFDGDGNNTGVSRNAPDSVSLNTYLVNKQFYDSILSAVPAKNNAPIKASVRLLSGCQDNQLSYENAFGGYFTNAVVDVWNGGKFSGNYATFHQRVVAKLPAYQSPNHMLVGKSMPNFNHSKPFSIQSV